MKPLLKWIMLKLVTVKFIFTIPMIVIKQKPLNQEQDMAVVRLATVWVSDKIQMIVMIMFALIAVITIVCTAVKVAQR